MNVPKDIALWLRTSYLDGFYHAQSVSPPQGYLDKIKKCEKEPDRIGKAERLASLKQQQAAYERGYADGRKKRENLKGGL